MLPGNGCADTARERPCSFWYRHASADPKIVRPTRPPEIAARILSVATDAHAGEFCDLRVCFEIWKEEEPVRHDPAAESKPY